MGIDAGILVTHQITDEGKWALAMQEVHRVFCGKDYFRREPPTPGLFTTMKADLWEVQEPLNFTGVHSERPLKFDDWDTYHKIFKGDVRDNPLTFAVKNLAELDERMRELEGLQEAFEMAEPQSDGELDWEDRDRGKELGRAKLALSNASAARTDPFQLEAAAHAVAGVLNPTRFGDDYPLCPPRLFRFDAYETCCLPVFARHFTAFQTKITGDT